MVTSICAQIPIGITPPHTLSISYNFHTNFDISHSTYLVTARINEPISFYALRATGTNKRYYEDERSSHLGGGFIYTLIQAPENPISFQGRVGFEHIKDSYYYYDSHDRRIDTDSPITALQISLAPIWNINMDAPGAFRKLALIGTYTLANQDHPEQYYWEQGQDIAPFAVTLIAMNSLPGNEWGRLSIDSQAGVKFGGEHMDMDIVVRMAIRYGINLKLW